MKHIVGKNVDNKMERLETEYRWEESIRNRTFSISSEKRLKEIINQVADMESSVLKVDSEFQSKGKEYNLNKKADFEELRKTTDMEYKLKSKGEEDMIFFQNGILNKTKQTEKSIKMLEEIVKNEKVGYIHNDTHGVIEDTAEYLPKYLTTKDVLNAKVYEDIANNGEKKNLIILHSARNEDAYKAMKVLEIENRSLDNKVDFISIGSPRSKGDLESQNRK